METLRVDAKAKMEGAPCADGEPEARAHRRGTEPPRTGDDFIKQEITAFIKLKGKETSLLLKTNRNRMLMKEA